MPPHAKPEGPPSLAANLLVWWSAIFAVLTTVMQSWLDPVQNWWPQLDLSGKQAVRVFSSPWFLGCWFPLIAGLVLVHRFADRNHLPHQEKGMMVWFMTNVFWFHTGCDLLSGFWQVMPNLTELYIAMNPSHTQPQWAEARGYLDAAYALELLVEVPLGCWVLWLYFTRDPARHLVEVFAVAVQLAGTVAYYVPPIARRETLPSWVSICDRAFGSVWIIFPLFILRRHMAAARSHSAVKMD
mmetsp:Transcript_144940/g.255473  ORF Transcript_144940/g.255473 Transcript_144940/m.255473 type:complete len:241 (+) Transcript_144940:99-821(+)